MQDLNTKVKKKMYMTIQEIEYQERGPVYVLNNTKQPEQGVVCFTVPKLGQNGVDNVVIPSTFIPIDLMEQISRKQLRESSEFKTAIRGRVLLLITEEYAKELLEDEDAQYEIERLYNLTQANRNLAHSMDSLETGDMIHPELAARNGQINNKENDVVEDVSPRVAAIVSKVMEDNDERGAISSLRMLEDLTDKDFTYIIKQCGKKFANLTSWATKRVS